MSLLLGHALVALISSELSSVHSRTKPQVIFLLVYCMGVDSEGPALQLEGVKTATIPVESLLSLPLKYLVWWSVIT